MSSRRRRIALADSRMSSPLASSSASCGSCCLAVSKPRLGVTARSLLWPCITSSTLRPPRVACWIDACNPASAELALARNCFPSCGDPGGTLSAALLPKESSDLTGHDCAVVEIDSPCSEDAACEAVCSSSESNTLSCRRSGARSSIHLLSIFLMIDSNLSWRMLGIFRFGAELSLPRSPEPLASSLSVAACALTSSFNVSTLTRRPPTSMPSCSTSFPSTRWSSCARISASFCPASLSCLATLSTCFLSSSD
mmetsp:Transcript_6555/g.11845  ORF Transcript_6555/g.11845 Transcript_6555/m.11845 type:complete len:253 (-) Transcript_6555:1568-2326(-)